MLDAPAGTFFQKNLEVNKSRGREGERRLCGARLIVKAMRTQTGVTMHSVFQPRKAGGSILTLVVNTAVEFHVAAISPPGVFPRITFRAVAGEGGPAVLTPAPILAGLTLALIKVYFTLFTCGETMQLDMTEMEFSLGVTVEQTTMLL